MARRRSTGRSKPRPFQVTTREEAPPGLEDPVLVPAGLAAGAAGGDPIALVAVLVALDVGLDEGDGHDAVPEWVGDELVLGPVGGDELGIGDGLDVEAQQAIVRHAGLVVHFARSKLGEDRALGDENGAEPGLSRLWRSSSPGFCVVVDAEKPNLMLQGGAGRSSRSGWVQRRLPPCPTRRMLAYPKCQLSPPAWLPRISSA
jgi:hypothetical protein